MTIFEAGAQQVQDNAAPYHVSMHEGHQHVYHVPHLAEDSMTISSDS